MFNNFEKHQEHLHPKENYDSHSLSPFAKRVENLKRILLSRGLITQKELTATILEFDQRTPFDGAKVVAKAWTNRAFRNRLITDATKAVAELGFHPPDDFQSLVVLPNTKTLHHLIVCTLCSCYPRWLLGRPPDWYKSLAYRSRAVIDPKGVMSEFGLTLDCGVRIKVVDSTAEVRYMVLPLRPKETDRFTREQLASLITRDSLIGVGLPSKPPRKTQKTSH